MDSAENEKHPCPTCGGRSYSWGRLTSHGITFVPDDASFLSKFFRFGTQLPARLCSDCGNIQIFAREPKHAAMD